ncbi:ATP-dependent RNA helicase DeaD [Planctomycetes bacterium Pla163]|uniref:ATP-dependent RNA helicase DeaD n=1 Tax=Rohdeia mirabilis TaxID=2528008 RepID=A0A518CZK9_9BACT|nr:ATP-dependent RNA helicase DeaD [Planctomycetes bacterium Pla163]
MERQENSPAGERAPVRTQNDSPQRDWNASDAAVDTASLEDELDAVEMDAAEMDAAPVELEVSPSAAVVAEPVAEALGEAADANEIDALLLDEDEPSFELRSSAGTDVVAEVASEAPVGADVEVESADAPEPVAETAAAPEAEPEPERTGPFARVPKVLVGALEGRGFDSLTLVQEAVLAPEAVGRDLKISSQTGSGKTVALGMVITQSLLTPRTDDGRGPDALIIVPTRELAQQVREELHWLFANIDGAHVLVVTGGTPVHADRTRLKRGARILVGTPGRLLDHVSSGVLDLSAVRELVLDEADQMLDMGFREELEGILDGTPSDRRTHMVSATFPDGIRRLAERYQRDALELEGTRLGEANANIEHQGHLVRGEDRYNALVNLLLLGGEQRSLVFVERRAEALELAELLEGDGFSALPLSGELAQSQRERTLGAFRDGRANVLVATDVAARGLDVPEVALVVHMAPPIDGQIYTHRSGRTGRAGLSGRSVLFAHPSRRRKVARILGDAGVDLTWLPIPGAAEVRKVVQARETEALKARIAESLTAEPDAGRLEAADALLAEHDARTLVAALLARLEPSGRAAARDVEVMRPVDDRRADGTRQRNTWREDRSSNQGERYGNDRGGSHGSRSDGPRHSGGERRPRVSDMGTVRFFMNYGNNQGATPGRLLAIACRRGDVTGSDIGSIAIHPNASTFDVNADVAARFEEQAGRRDPRDPRIMIRRDRDGGPAASGDRGDRPARGGFVPDRGRDFGPGQGRSNSGYQRRDNDGRGQRPGGSQGGYSGRPNGGYRGREDDRRPRY